MIGAGKILTQAPRLPAPLDTFPVLLRRGPADVTKFPGGMPLRQAAYTGHLLMSQRADV